MLAGKVLQVANSAFYRRGGEVTSLQRAAMVIGMRALKVVALGFTLANELPASGESGRPRPRRLLASQRRHRRHRALARPRRSIARSSRRRSSPGCSATSASSRSPRRRPTRTRPSCGPAAAGPRASGRARAPRRSPPARRPPCSCADWGVPELIVVGLGLRRPTPASSRRTRRPRRAASLELVRLARLGSHVLFERRRRRRAPRPVHRPRRSSASGSRPRRSTRSPTGSSPRSTKPRASSRSSFPPGVSYQALLDQARTADGRDDGRCDGPARGDVDATVECSSGRTSTSSRSRTPTRSPGCPNRGALDAFLAQQVRTGAAEAAARLPRRADDRRRPLQAVQRHLRPPRRGRGAALVSAARSPDAARDSDVLARYGGEEFCLVVPEADPELLARRGRAAPRRDRRDRGRPRRRRASQRVTASFGGACLAEVTSPTTPPAQLLAAADARALPREGGGTEPRARRAGARPSGLTASIGSAA